MRTEQRTIYIAEDESEHNSEIDAAYHECKLDLEQWCEDKLFRDNSVQDNVETIVDNIEKFAPIIDALYKFAIAKKKLASSGRA